MCWFISWFHWKMFPERNFLAQIVFFPVVQVLRIYFKIKHPDSRYIWKKWPSTSQIFLNMLISNYFLGPVYGQQEKRQQHKWHRTETSDDFLYITCCYFISVIFYYWHDPYWFWWGGISVPYLDVSINFRIRMSPWECYNS